MKKLTEEDMRKKHLNHMTNVVVWMYGSVCSLIKRNKDKPKTMGLLAHIDGSVEPVVYLACLFEVNQKTDWSKVEKISFNSWEALRDAGWEVD